MGLAHCGWTVGECKTKFTELVGLAFTPRLGMGTGSLREFLKFVYNYAYQSEKAERALQSGFGRDNPLFGSAIPVRVKVAVTTVEMNGSTTSSFKTHLLSNYSRPSLPSTDIFLFSSLSTSLSYSGRNH